MWKNIFVDYFILKMGLALEGVKSISAGKGVVHLKKWKTIRLKFLFISSIPIIDVMLNKG